MYSQLAFTREDGLCGSRVEVGTLPLVSGGVGKMESDVDFILNRVDRSNSFHWLWRGYRDKGGYGRTSNSRTKLVHRLSYQAFIGPIPFGKVIGHSKDCPYRHCVSPACLSAMTQAENQTMTSSELHGLGIFQRVKTHCPQGHEYTEENTFRYRRRRVCRECARQRSWKRRKNG